MSENLRKCVKKLLALSRSKLTDIRKHLKKAPRNLIKAVSEIAYNITEGVIQSKKLSKDKIVKLLSNKKTTLQQKQKLLRATAAAATIKGIILAVAPILRSLTNGA